MDILNFRVFKDGQNVGQMHIFFEIVFKIVRILDKLYVACMPIAASYIMQIENSLGEKNLCWVVKLYYFKFSGK